MGSFLYFWVFTEMSRKNKFEKNYNKKNGYIRAFEIMQKMS